MKNIILSRNMFLELEYLLGKLWEDMDLFVAIIQNLGECHFIHSMVSSMVW